MAAPISEGDQLKIVSRVRFTDELNEGQYFTLAITENNIEDKQFVDTAVVDDYNHMFILRDVITSDPKGDLLDDH